MMELLSPAGGWEAMTAAVQNGADAVYMGFGGLNARRSARNFTDEEFREAVAYCHLRGVKVYLTLNTLVTDRELPAAAEALKKASDMGVDAILIQDWGIWRMAREIAPDVPLHASTQMSLHTLGGACRAAELGLERVVLARELSRRDIHTITRDCPAEIEVFGHGALCMCYSGQCEMSAVIGGRSGNRGACAQPCRLPYGVNEKAAGGHPLSLKDANLADYVQELEQMGVACLKLEGRMKRPEYVAVITGIYRRLLDEKRGPSREESRQLEAAFSRSGFTDGYYKGRTGPEMFGTRPENAPEPKELFARAKAGYSREDSRRVPVDMVCTLRAGVPAQLTASAKGHTVRAEGPAPEEARNRALTAEELQARLEKTGGTVFRPRETRVELEEGLMLPASAVNALRRQALEGLEAALAQPPVRRTGTPSPLPQAQPGPDAPVLTCSIMRPEQLTEPLAQCETVYVPAELLEKIEAKGVGVGYVTLHVGLGTFRPVKAEEVLEHHMHSELCMMNEQTARILNETKASGGRIVCVGTTSCRTLESLVNDDGTFEAKSRWTDIFIYPGYRFKTVDHLVTNFHLPESTLMMLISAFATREQVMAAYAEAVKEEYRFFSFGDSMLLY